MKYTTSTEDLIIDNSKFTMIYSRDSVDIDFKDVVAANIDAWEASAIHVAIRISDKTMSELCKAWVKRKKIKKKK